MTRVTIPYGRQTIDDEDVEAVVRVLRSDWLTTGPEVGAFEKDFAEFCGVEHAVAVSNGTAALHCAYAALGVGPGDEVIVPAMTFAATANAAVYLGATPVFADVDDERLLLDPESVRRLLTPKTKVVAAVDYAGHPCDYDALRNVLAGTGVRLAADACHALGGSRDGRPVGSLAEASTFSFHPVKPITTGEGGMITTSDEQIAAQMRRFRAHGVTVDFRERMEKGSWKYDMVELGYNYRLSDLQCALGRSQLRKLPEWTRRRNALASQYDSALEGLTDVRTLPVADGVVHGFHLYSIRVPAPLRSRVFELLREQGIGVNVHYIPVNLHPYYQNTSGGAGRCPVAEQAYQELITLPLFPAMSDADVEAVARALRSAMEEAGA